MQKKERQVWKQKWISNLKCLEAVLFFYFSLRSLFHYNRWQRNNEQSPIHITKPIIVLWRVLQEEEQIYKIHHSFMTSLNTSDYKFARLSEINSNLSKNQEKKFHETLSCIASSNLWHQTVLQETILDIEMQILYLL